MGLEVHDRTKYSGNKTREDKDNIYTREGSTGGNNQGLGETSDWWEGQSDLKQEESYFSK